MSSPSLEDAAQWVLRRYPIAQAAPVPLWLGNNGGFSGASIWRVETASGPLCLRAGPPGEANNPNQLSFIHHLLTEARHAGLGFIPTVHRTTDKATWLEYAQRTWQLLDWMPGTADFHISPNIQRLQSACISLARLHRCWEKAAPISMRPCPALRRRQESLLEWTHSSSLKLPPIADMPRLDPLEIETARARRFLPGCLPHLHETMQQWQASTWKLQPCLCDLWHDNVLFDGDQVAAFVDFNAVKEDHVSVDLARLLGSLVGDDVLAWQQGLQAYQQIRPLTPLEVKLAHDLDRTGTVLGVIQWLRWLYLERRQFPDRFAAARRLASLTNRMETWQGSNDRSP